MSYPRKVVRFGNSSASSLYRLKIRWLIGSLTLVVSLLFVAIVSLLRSPQSAGATAAQSLASSNSAATVDIVVAQSRIEEGQEIKEDQLSLQPIAFDRLPPGAITAQQRGELTGRFAKAVLRPNMPILREDVAMVEPRIKVPVGYFAETILVDNRSSLEGWVQPQSRVDVVLVRNRNGEPELQTIANFVKVLSLNGRVRPAEGLEQTTGSVPVTLLVDPKQAKAIELSRAIGSLTLFLRSENEDPSKLIFDREPVSLSDVTNPGPKESAKPEESPNVLCTTEASTGRRIKFSLHGTKWQREQSDCV